jgi:hypothetical protein
MSLTRRQTLALGALAFPVAEAAAKRVAVETQECCR